MIPTLFLLGFIVLAPLDSARADFDPTKTPGLVDAQKTLKDLKVDLKYSTTDNFMKRDAYGAFDRCFLQQDATTMLAEAEKKLMAMRPDLRFLALDCVRPLSVQFVMWEVVKNTPQQKYVADPNTRTGSIHNYGCAVDLTLATQDGKAVDMGTPFDFFGHKAQPRHEFSFYRKGELSPEALANRLLLREVMIRAGFFPISNEWWHFNCASNSAARKRYKKVL